MNEVRNYELPKVLKRLAIAICKADGIYQGQKDTVHLTYLWEDYIPQAEAAYKEMIKLDEERMK